MSKKGYSKQDRERVGQDLLAVGLEMLSQRGLKKYKTTRYSPSCGHLQTIFHNNYYTSLAELVIHIINYEVPLLLQVVREDAARQDITPEEKIERLLYRVTHSRQHHLFVMTQEEEMWVYKHLGRRSSLPISKDRCDSMNKYSPSGTYRRKNALQKSWAT